MRKRVVDVELHAMRHLPMQAGQQRVVVRVALVPEVQLARELGIAPHVRWNHRPNTADPGIQRCKRVAHVPDLRKGIEDLTDEIRTTEEPEVLAGSTVIRTKSRIDDVFPELSSGRSIASP